MPRALLERDAELAALAARLDGAGTGGGALMVVEGPAGIGKTSLLAATAQAAREREMTLLHARGAPLEQTFSFGIARQLLEPVRASCGRAEWAELTAGAAALAARALEAPAGDGGGGEDAAHATVHGLFWLVANLANRRPALLVVDDAHWADPPSLRWLGHLARRLDGLPLLLAVAVRAGEPSSDHRLLDDLLAAATAPPLRPRPLGRAAAASVVREQFAGPVDDGFCNACHAATGGNPFLLRALVASLRADGVAPTREAAPAIESFGPEAVARAVARQLERLPAGAVELARAVAVLADDAALRRVAALAGLGPSRAAGVADALRAAGVLAPETRLEFAHPVVRAAIYAGLRPGERGLSHERAARLLRAEGAEPERVATHLLHTEPGATADTVTALRAAARDASARGAPETAAVYLRRALDEGPDPNSRPGVLLELGLALAAHAHPDAAGLLREAAEVTAEPAARAAAGLRGARALGMAGRFAEARTVCRAAVSQTADMPPEAVARLESELIALAWLGPRPPSRRPANDSAARSSTRRRSSCGGWTPRWRPPSRAARRATCSRCCSRPSRQRAGCRTGLHAPGRDGAGPALERRARHGACAVRGDRRNRAAAGLAHHARARELLGVHGRAAIRRGAEAEADARLAFDSMLAGKVPPAALMWALFPLVDALVERDAPDAAEARAYRRRPAELLPDQLGARACWRPVRACPGPGAPEEARDDRRSGERGSFRHPPPRHRRLAGDAALALAALGDTAESARGSPASTSRWPSVSARRARSAPGCARRTLPPPPRRIALLERAVTILAPSPTRLEHVRALWSSAPPCAARPSPEARDPLRDALDLADRGGLAARPPRPRGADGGGARPRRAALSGPDALTAAEHRVAALAAAGHTNREIAQQLFVTQRTVETHLSHAFPKLDITSRDRLAAALWPVEQPAYAVT